ncbi:MAG: hypothetical protein WC061_09335 [Melioribacteraceae bacterium]
MNRKEFLKTSAGFAALMVAPGIWNINIPQNKKRNLKFENIFDKNFLAPVTRVTPDDGIYVHTYFDVTPFSPSQKYMAVSKLPFQDRMPVQGDLAEVCIIDLENQNIKSVYKTKSWGYQTGTNVQWGADDRHVYCNDKVGDTAVGIQINIETGETKAFAGPMYSVARNESCYVGFPLELFDITQLGYGCPPEKLGVYKTLPLGASKTEGIWRTDLKTNEKKLIVSLHDAASVLPGIPPVEDYTFYFWHSKFNRQGTRVYQVLRCLFGKDPYKAKERNPVNITFKPDGTEIFYTTPNYPVWGSGGGHPNWHPNGEYLIRHLKLEDGRDRFVQFKYDGSEFFVLTEKIQGGGHPSIEENSRYLITDAQKIIGDTKNVSLRLIDLKAEQEMIVCTLPSIKWEGHFDDNVFRLDGHPVWSRDYKKVSLQAAHNGKRQLFVIDLSKLI